MKLLSVLSVFALIASAASFSPTIQTWRTNTALSMERRSILQQTFVTAVSTTLASTLPRSAATAEPTRLWLDADPSGFVWTGLDCDDDLAILVALALEQNQKLQLEAISVCGGNAPLRHTRKDMQVLLRYADGGDFKEGYGWRDMQISRKWLKWMNQIQPDVLSSQQASRAIHKAAFNDNNPQKLNVLTLGPPTNLARALEQNPALASRLGHVYMMGGDLTHQRLDLNFASDRAAARTVVQANVPTTLIPIQLCAQVVLDGAFVDELESQYCTANSNAAAVCALLPKLRQQVRTMPELVNQAVQQKMPDNRRWRPSPNLDQGFIPWDIVAVLAVSNPELLDEWEYHRVEFPACGDEGEPCDRTMVVQDLPREQWPTTRQGEYNHSGIVRIPHVVKNEGEMKNLMKDLLGQIRANPQMNEPRIMPGFLAPVGGLAGGTLAGLAALVGNRIGRSGT